MNLNLESALNLFIAFIISIGGSSAIFFGLSNWLGNLIANRLLDKWKAEKEGELEALKNHYTIELEKYRTNAALLISQVERFSNQQFSLYSQLWIALIDLKIYGDDLWNRATYDNLLVFTNQLRITDKAVQEGSLFLEETHYTQIVSILKVFKDFQLGKKRLVELKNRQDIRVSQKELNTEIEFLLSSINSEIQNNRNIREIYSSLINEIRFSFIRQIKNTETTN